MSLSQAFPAGQRPKRHVAGAPRQTVRNSSHQQEVCRARQNKATRLARLLSVDRTLNRHNEPTLPLYFVQYQQWGTFDQLIGTRLGLATDIEVIQRQVLSIRQFRQSLYQCALFRLTATCQHDDRHDFECLA